MVFDFKSFRFIQRTVSVFGEDDLPGVERFISGFDAYLKSVIVEAEDRVTGKLRTVSDYIIIRRDTCAAKPTFACLGLGLHIPHEVFENPFFISLLDNAADLILISNVSYLIIFDGEPDTH
jgi:Delta6-protoilludene synthase